MRWSRFFGVLFVVLFTLVLNARRLLIMLQNDFHEDYTNFLGEKWWSNEQLALCDDVGKDLRWQRSDAVCLTYLYHLLPVDLEIVSWSPTLIIYRNMLNERQRTEFLNYIEQEEMVAQKTSDHGTSRETTHRRANGSFIQHGAAEITQEVHEMVQKRVPALNLTNAELFSALSYLPGGHYSVHYDYLGYRSESDHDWWMKNMGNRIGTMIFVLQTAEEGGGTIFQSIGTTIRVNHGDAFFWFNTRSDESQEMLADHGGCPIYSGRKVITTLWIRAKNQPVVPMDSPDAPINAHWMIPGLTEQFRNHLTSQCDGI